MIKSKQISSTTALVNRFLCKEKCPDPDPDRIFYCYKCEIKRNCNGLKGHNQHYIIYNCDTCAFEDNIKQICRELNENEDEVLKCLKQIFYSAFSLQGIWSTKQRKI